MKKKVIYLLILILLTLACWLTATFYFGSASFGSILGLVPVWLILFAVLSWIFIVALKVGSKRVSAKVWFISGLLVLAGWCIPAATFVQLFPYKNGEPFGTSLAFTLLVVFSLSLITVAFLLISGLKWYDKWKNAATTYYENSKPRSKHAGKTALFVIIFSLILLARAIVQFYWFMIWDFTTDGLGYLWLPLPILALMASTIFLCFALPDGAKVAALLYLLLIPALITISAHTQQIDFHQLTGDRAEQISQALDNYYVQKGRYPQDLQELIPRHFILIPAPIIIYGQNWCYDGGADYYRLGYVDREHWSSRHLTGQVFRTWGSVPDLPAICQQEATELIESRPDLFWFFEE